MLCCASKRSPEEARAHYIEQRLSKVGGLFQAASLLAEHRSLLQGSNFSSGQSVDQEDPVALEIARKRCAKYLDHIEKLKQSLLKSETEIGDLRRNLESEKSTRDGHAKRAANAEAALMEARAMIEKLKAELLKLQGTRDRLKKEVEEIKAKAAEDWKNAETLWTEVKKCDEKGKEVCTKFQQKLAGLHAKVTEAKGQMTSLTQRLGKDKQLTAQELARAQSAELELQKAQNMITDLRNTIERYTTEIMTFEKDLAVSKADHQKAEDEEKTAKAKRDQMCVNKPK